MPDNPLPVYTIVRQILAENLDLPSEDVITRAREKGVTRTAAELRPVINNVRSEMRGNKKRGKRPKSGAAPGPSAYSLAREILTADQSLSNDDVLARIKARGVTKPDAYIREAIRGTRNDIRSRGAKPVPTAARTIPEPKPAPEVSGEAAVPVSGEVPGEAALFAGLALVNKTARLCGGFAKAREIAEAIRSCGGIDAFLKRVELVAEILGSGAPV
ncbi:MAG: hypothetical protein J0I06_16225 [Planctomycetes bacterium]|nr:hypothetical protein [Planctomycetota bacterium]